MLSRYLFLGFVALSCSMAALAEESAAQIERRFDEPQAPKSLPAAPGPKLIEDGLPPEGANAIRFTLTAVQLKKSGIYDAEKLAELYKPYLNQEISLLDMYNIRDTITALYGNDGYVLSRAYIPKQEIEKGVVKINIVEGYVDEVILEGAFGNRKALFDAYAEKIKAERPFNIYALERYTLLARDLPGVHAETQWQKSENNPNAATIRYKVSIETAKPFGSLTIDNRGTDANGPVQITPIVALANPFGYFSNTSFLYATTTDTEELLYLSLSHNQTLNSEGTVLGIFAAHSRAEPSIELLSNINQNSKSKTLSLSLIHPVIRTRQSNWLLSGKFESKDSESFTLGLKTFEDKLRVARLSSSLDYSDSYGGITQAIAEWSHGFKGMGATDNNSSLKTRSDGVADFDKFSLYLSRTQNMRAVNESLRNWQLFVALNGQYSNDALLSSEECGIGGKQFGRGYDSSELTGEHCIALSMEARYQFDTNSEYLNQLQGYGFWDIGEVRSRNPSASVLKSESLVSAGAGFRFQLLESASGSVELAKPLTRTVANEDDKNLRVFASLSLRF